MKKKTAVIRFDGKLSTVVEDIPELKEGEVLVLNSKTCGINKDGNELYKVNPVTGERDYSKLDDQLSEDCDAIIRGILTEHSTYIPLNEIIKSNKKINLNREKFFELLNDLSYEYNLNLSEVEMTDI